MSSDPIETFEHAGLTCALEYDPDPSSPSDWDTIGTFTQWHRRYTFGAPVDGPQRAALERGGPRLLARYLELVEHAAGILPVGLYDHSGLSVYAGGGPALGDAAGWDSGTVGFMWTSRERIRELCGDGPEYQTPEWIADALAAEVRTWDDYLTGAVIGWTVSDADGILDGCWGHYPDASTPDDVHGYRSARADARAAAECEARRIADAAECEARERWRAACMDVATA